MIDFDLLSKIIRTPGAPGHEKPVRELLTPLLEDLCDEVYTDGIGNLIARKKGSGPRVMLAAHMDEISLIVTHIDASGFIRFSTLGGFDPATLVSQRVMVHGREELPGVIGTKPVHIQSDSEKKSAIKLENLFIDVGLPEKKVKEQVSPGTVITRDREMIRMGDFVTAKSLDNRISVYILLEALKRQQGESADLFAVFTTQEEVGLRGARVAAQAIQPEIGINLDVTLANDLPGVSEQDYCTKAGEGIAIKIMDKSIICTPSLTQFLMDLAEQNNIPYQREVLTAGGTDTSAMQYLMGIGSHVTSISCPARYIHSTAETCAISDVEAGIRLTTEVMSSLKNYSFQ